MLIGLACFPAEGLMTPVLEEFEADAVPPADLDLLLADGWRHFGRKFFRYNFALHEGRLCGVLPLRVRVRDFAPSRSGRRTLRRNADLATRIVPAGHSAEYDDLFARHRERFLENQPDSLRDFLSERPADVPCETVAVELRLAGRLAAVSFLDLAADSVSSIYAAFEPALARRSLGILTLLREIDLARTLGKTHHYLGYAYTVPSAYDYKKRLPALEAYDWGHGWVTLPADYEWSRRVILPPS